MATKVYMEALSPTMEEGRLIGWQKQEGDEVKEGDVLAEIETDKATMELVARGSGILRKILLGDGGTAPVGTVIAVVAEADEDISAIIDEAAPVAAEAPVAESTPSEPAAPVAPATPEVAAAEAAAPSGDDRIKASPLARRLAAEAGLDLATVSGSGPGGRITKRDIEAASTQAAAPAVAAPSYEALEGAEVVEVPVTQMRKTIARRLATSIGPVPTFYLTAEVDMNRLLEVRKQLNERLEARGSRVSINDLVIKATAVALSQHPEINASWGEDVIRQYGRVHIGVAVAIDEGLITPIIRDADRKGVSRIGAEVREMAGRARERKLKPEEYTGATFSISNLGMFGIQEFTAIINPPESAILAVGTVEEKAVVVEGRVEVRSRMRLTLSCDHRVIDGAMGARFLQTLRDNLEEPTMMLA